MVKEECKKTANQNIRPLTCQRNAKGELEIGGCALSDLVRQFGSPLYVYDYATIKSVISDFKKAFENTDIHMMYASKAFMTKASCKIMQKEGLGLDCVSAGELYTAYSSGFDMSNIVFNGNNKSVEEIKLAIEWGVKLFSVDNFTEAKNLNKICTENGQKIDILLRITPGIECHTHEYIQTGHLDSKFGFDLTQVDEITNLIKNEYLSLNIVGLHAHLGSQIFQTEVYKDAIKILMSEAKRIKDSFGIEIKTFNLGGGAGIKYVESDKPFSIFEVAEVIKDALKQYSAEFGIQNPHLYIEPGRCIVGTAGITVYTVGSYKQVPKGKKYISVDGGMSDNIRTALYGAKYTVDTVSLNNQPVETVTLAGKHCESGDVIVSDIKMPQLTEGDLICVYNTGAYCYSMASNYNRIQKPAVVLVQDGKAEIIVKRQSLEQICEDDLIAEMI